MGFNSVAYNKEYYEKNKTTILEKGYKKEHCNLCNQDYMCCNKSKHLKTRRHQYNITHPNDLQQKKAKSLEGKSKKIEKPKMRINGNCIIITGIDDDINHELINALKKCMVQN